jgi:hypothetical protein
VVVRTDLRMAATPVCVNRLSDDDGIRQYMPGRWTVLVCVRLVIRSFCDSTLRAHPGGCKPPGISARCRDR